MAGPVPFRPVSSEVQVAFKALELDRITIHLRCLFGRFEFVRPAVLTDQALGAGRRKQFRHFNWKRH